MAVLPEHGFTVVALTNLANAPAAKLSYGLANAAVGRAPDAPLAEHPQHTLAPEQLRRYAGTYLGQPGTTVAFAERDGVLYVSAGEQEQAALKDTASALGVTAI